MAEFGEDFDLDAFQRAYESDDPLLLRLLTSERTAGRPERRDKSCWLRFPVGLPPPPLGCARLRGGRHGRLRPLGRVQ
jgi:hypothetical protein